MKDISEIPFIQGHKAWYFLSVFYARENWPELVYQINHFYQDRKDKFQTCLISFSEDKGEQIEISLASSSSHENLKDEIDSFFLSFMANFPSTLKTAFPYGNAVWCNYPNNTLLWSRLRNINLSDSYADFHQISFQYALSLIEDDTSQDTLFSVCLYLIAKGLYCIEPEKQKQVLSDTLHETSTDFRNYSHKSSIKALIDEHIDLQEICSVLESYMNEYKTELSPELKLWLANTKKFIEGYGYIMFCSYICTMLGLNGLHQLAMLELMNICYSRQ